MTFTEQVQQFWLRNAKIRNGQLPDYPLGADLEKPSMLMRLMLALALICFGIALVMLAPVVMEWFRQFIQSGPVTPSNPQTSQESLYQDLEDRGLNVPIQE